MVCVRCLLLDTRTVVNIGIIIVAISNANFGTTPLVTGVTNVITTSDDDVSGLLSAINAELADDEAIGIVGVWTSSAGGRVVEYLRRNQDTGAFGAGYYDLVNSVSLTAIPADYTREVLSGGGGTLSADAFATTPAVAVAPGSALHLLNQILQSGQETSAAVEALSGDSGASSLVTLQPTVDFVWILDVSKYSVASMNLAFSSAAVARVVFELQIGGVHFKTISSDNSGSYKDQSIRKFSDTNWSNFRQQGNHQIAFNTSDVSAIVVRISDPNGVATVQFSYQLSSSSLPIDVPVVQEVVPLTLTDSGILPMGYSSVHILNSGTAAGTVLTQPLSPGDSVSFSTEKGELLGSIPYNATGTTFTVKTLQGA